MNLQLLKYSLVLIYFRIPTSDLSCASVKIYERYFYHTKIGSTTQPLCFDLIFVLNEGTKLQEW